MFEGEAVKRRQVRFLHKRLELIPHQRIRQHTTLPGLLLLLFGWDYAIGS
jgi:hypothetical protein